ncbi:unnamed protein product [Linum trigynum]|uniref:Uncharacterized protein n=1 Tax=Linum trigynum TaxID=586398 RepID=A0AAV2E636_9ROSI
MRGGHCCDARGSLWARLPQVETGTMDTYKQRHGKSLRGFTMKKSPRVSLRHGVRYSTSRKETGDYLRAGKESAHHRMDLHQGRRRGKEVETSLQTNESLIIEAQPRQSPMVTQRRDERIPRRQARPVRENQLSSMSDDILPMADPVHPQAMTRRRRMILEDESEDDLPILRKSMQPSRRQFKGRVTNPRKIPSLSVLRSWWGRHHLERDLPSIHRVSYVRRSFRKLRLGRERVSSERLTSTGVNKLRP